MMWCDSVCAEIAVIMTSALGAVGLLVELVLLVSCTCIVSVRQDVAHRELHKAPRPRVDAVIKAASRCVFVLGGFMCILAWSICNPEFFLASTWSLAAFLHNDFFSIKTALHGCFLIGGYANWTMTGNMRYATLMLTVMVAIAVPAFTFFVLTAASLFAGSADCLMHTSLSAILLVLCASVFIAVWQARSAVFTTDSVEFPALRQQQQQQQPAAYADIQARFSAAELNSYNTLRRVVRTCIYSELTLLLATGLSQLVTRLPHERDGCAPLGQFVHFLLDACTNSIHIGWLLGNGLNAVNAHSLESMKLFGFGKFVMGLLALTENIAAAYTASTTVSTVASAHTVSDAAFWFGWLSSALQLASAAGCWMLLRSLAQVEFTDDTHFISMRGSVASSFGFSLLSFAGLPDTPPELSRIAKCTAHCVLASVTVFLFECLLLVWLDNSVEAVVSSFNFCLHFSALFMLCFFRSVQDYKKRLSRPGWTLQAFVMLIYTVTSASHLVSALAAIWVQRSTNSNDSRSQSSTSIGSGLWAAVLMMAVRAIVNGQGIGYFVRLKFDSADANADAPADPDRGEGDIERRSLLNANDSESQEPAQLQPAHAHAPAPAAAQPLPPLFPPLFSRARLSLVLFWCVFAVFAATLAGIDAAGHSMAAMGMGSSDSFANVFSHSRAAAIAFHFAFLTFGFMYRGVSAANVMFLQFTGLTAFTLLATLLSWFAAQMSLFGFQFEPLAGFFTLLFAAMALILLFTTTSLHNLAAKIQLFPHLFPQTTHAMV